MVGGVSLNLFDVFVGCFVVWIVVFAQCLLFFLQIFTVISVSFFVYFGMILAGFGVIRRIIDGILCHSPNF